MRPIAIDPTNTDDAPICRVDCPYLMRFNSYALQRNAIRSELAHMIHQWRCGWNIKPNRIGGHPLDYEPCIFK